MSIVYEKIRETPATLCLKMLSSYMSFFFFSSRRRHTRLTCDWSSDVCSSDLVAEGLDGIQFAVVPGSFQKLQHEQDRKSTRLHSSHMSTSYAVFCLKKKGRKLRMWLPRASVRRRLTFAGGTAGLS